MTASEIRQLRGETLSLIHYARAQVMDTIVVTPDGPVLVGKAKGREARWETAATMLSKAAWTLRGKDLRETVR